MCFILRLAPCFVATARAVLLSALACIRNDSPIYFRIACAKINSADNAPRTYISDSPLDKASVHLSSTFTRQEKLINETQGTRCAFPRHWVTGPVSIRISRDVFSRSCSSHSVSMQVSSGRDSVHVFLSNISTLSWHVSNLQVLVTQVCMTRILSQTSNLVSLR